jgi:hypothetical protein
MKIKLGELKSQIREMFSYYGNKQLNLKRDMFLFKNLGLEPIEHGEEQTSYLGMGAYSRVYEILYNGKRAVAKVSHDSLEGETYAKIMHIREQCPAWVAAALPMVYDVIETYEDQLMKGANTAVVIITEFLMPMTIDLTAGYWGDSGSKHTSETTLNHYRRNADVLFSNHERLYQLISDHVEEDKLESVESLNTVKNAILKSLEDDDQAGEEVAYGVIEK